jgi:DtxR family transcriptional regulator, manganese transport regulator
MPDRGRMARKEAAVSKQQPCLRPTGDQDRERAANFRKTREARNSEIAEDYVELIADLVDHTREARAVDIARRLGVAQATVVKTVSRLQREGLVMTRPYRAVFLTDKGRDLAERSRRRHGIVEEFLLSLGVSREAAQRDAEGMEHHVGEETLAAFEAAIERTRSRSSRR